MNPFEFINSVNFSKENIIEANPDCEKDYLPFITNKSLSYFPDTIFQSQSMNENSHIDNRLQYDFFLNSVSKRRRYSKWTKPEKQEIIDCLKRRYHYNDTKAHEALKCLTDDQIREIIQSETTMDGSKELHK